MRDADRATVGARLATARLVLRAIRADDIERCVEILVATGHAVERDHVADFQEEVDHWGEHGFGPWVALARESGEIVGTIDVNYAGPGLEGIDPDEIELGWMIERRLWRRGLASEGARAAADDAFRRLGVSSLVAYVRPDNAASIRVAEKLGMAYEGDGRTRGGDAVRIYRMRR